MKWPCRTIAATCLVLGLASPLAAGQVRLEIRDGLVTLEATDATLREIFAEWSRVGQTRVINAERVPGGPVTLQLNNVPERKALEILLRSIAGFVAAPRAVAQASASAFDRIMLMPVPRPAVVASSAATAPSTPNQAQLPRYVQPPNIVVDDQDEPLPTSQMPLPGQPSGAAQPGMMTTPNPQMTPYNGAGMGSPNQPAMNQQGMPNNNPYGQPYGIPYNPTNPAGGTPTQIQPSPQSATRPGMPTAQPQQPTAQPQQPIKSPQPGGEIRH